MKYIHRYNYSWCQCHFPNDIMKHFWRLELLWDSYRKFSHFQVNLYLSLKEGYSLLSFMLFKDLFDISYFLNQRNAVSMKNISEVYTLVVSLSLWSVGPSLFPSLICYKMGIRFLSYSAMKNNISVCICLSI